MEQGEDLRESEEERGGVRGNGQARIGGGGGAKEGGEAASRQF